MSLYRFVALLLKIHMYKYSYRLCLCMMLNTMRAIAARMPAMHRAVMQANKGSATVRNSFTTTVRSGGTLPPAKK